MQIKRSGTKNNSQIVIDYVWDIFSWNGEMFVLLSDLLCILGTNELNGMSTSNITIPAHFQRLAYQSNWHFPLGAKTTVCFMDMI